VQLDEIIWDERRLGHCLSLRAANRQA
jgi:hypothetical protein